MMPARAENGEFLPFYIPRPKMPQVDDQYYPWFVSLAFKGEDYNGPGCNFEVVPVNSLRAHQRINKRRADTMPADLKLKPIIVSSDGYIVDGNHRWWAHVHGKDEWINVIRLDLSFDNALDWTRSLPFVYEITPSTAERN
jgi:hypothetical protein